MQSGSLATESFSAICKYLLNPCYELDTMLGTQESKMWSWEHAASEKRQAPRGDKYASRQSNTLWEVKQQSTNKVATDLGCSHFICLEALWINYKQKYIHCFFFQLYWGYNWCITLCKSKVYNVMIWYMYILWNDYYNKIS